jgi:nitrogen fixation protein FixH
VSRAVWRKPYRLGGRYYGTEEDGNPLFRDALEKLIACYAAARTAEEERAVAAAGRAYKLAAEEAALVHIQLMRHSEKEEVRLAAANQVADRAGLIKPTKLDVTSGGERVRTYTVLAHPGLWDDDAESGS